MVILVQLTNLRRADLSTKITFACKGIRLEDPSLCSPVLYSCQQVQVLWAGGRGQTAGEDKVCGGKSSSG